MVSSVVPSSYVSYSPRLLVSCFPLVLHPTVYTSYSLVVVLVSSETTVSSSPVTEATEQPHPLFLIWGIPTVSLVMSSRNRFWSLSCVCAGRHTHTL